MGIVSPFAVLWMIQYPFTCSIHSVGVDVFMFLIRTGLENSMAISLCVILVRYL
jgi:hypothetical protein